MFPWDIKELYQGISFDELTFTCVYCQSTFINCDSPQEIFYYHEKCDYGIMYDPAYGYNRYIPFKKFQNRLKTYNPFLFPDFKTVLDLADEGFIFAGFNFESHPQQIPNS